MTRDLTTAAFWDRTWTERAPGRARLLGQLRTAIHWKFDRALCRLIDAVGKPEADILELGCAPGTILERIHQLRPRNRLHGVDFAPDGCQLARQRFEAARMQVELYQGDVRSIELPQRYDLVLSCGFIEHFEDSVAILRSHVRFAATGGLVAVTVPDFTPRVPHFFIKRFHPEMFSTHNLKIMNESCLATAMREASLHDVTVGRAGGPQLVSDVSRRGLVGTLYRRSAQMWNVLVAPLPDMLWHSYVWGLGRA